MDIIGKTITVQAAYNKMLETDAILKAPESQRHMVACLALKEAMPDTLENLIALRDIMGKPQ